MCTSILGRLPYVSNFPNRSLLINIRRILDVKRAQMIQNRFFTIIVCLAMVGCSAALPQTQDVNVTEALVEKDILAAAQRTEVSAKETRQNLMQAKELHSQVKAMLEESRAIRSECLAVVKKFNTKQRQIRKKAAQKKKVKKVIDPRYSPSDMPESK